MKHIFQRILDAKITPRRFFGFIALVAVALTAMVMTSCEDDLDVQQSYPFTVDVMPYGDKISEDETVELRFTIRPEGNFANTMYTIRYFQYEGDGTLTLVDGPTLTNNDRVLLESKTFRLNYTANSADAHKFLVVIEDNFGSTPWEQTFEFNADENGGGGGGLVGPIVGPITPIIR